eukprot:CAMPEP_0202686984 /NCGR_PEP_ID=MMETSP1385-20130828/2714_1 /ASSEMBLY_ACC=CAM_ASM_000861 /TAXON_ID=933848 /ORGANISM="Elphidium margaritaceum" /LENGTH=816 /DNA_ID=CAMNT_0049341685 /DNA_START=32 /DNA_END=2482 /DNA_ORIENTATION=-
MNFEEAEKIDGLRLSWNVWPTTRLEQVKMVIPLGVMYTPLMNQQECFRCEYPALQCRKDSCQAILSPWSEVDWTNKLWVCPLCLTRNVFPPSYNHISPQNMPSELDQNATTIEYEQAIPVGNPAGAQSTATQAQQSPAFLFVIDTAIPENELEAIKASIEQTLATLPEDCLVGLITFGKHVNVHEIGYTQCNKCIVFRGDIHNDEEKLKNFTVDRIKHLLEVQPMQTGIARFFQPIADVLSDFNEILEGITVDQWRAQRACRPDKCTGVACQVAVALMEACLPAYNGRIMLFSGGPPTVGPGRVVESSLAKHLRGHRDIVKGKAPLYEPACKFYNALSNRCVSNSHVFDIFACSLDQLGIAEQRIMCDNTGGCLVLSDTFTTSVFEESFNGLFYSYEVPVEDEAKDGDADEEAFGQTVLAMTFNGEIKIRCSRQIKVSGCMGAVSSMNETSTTCISSNEVGLGQTTKWSIGGLFSNTTLCFLFDVANTDNASASGNDGAQNNNNEEFGYIQFITSYTTSYNTAITRVTTIGIEFVNPLTKVGTDKIIGGFDQEAAAVILARLATFKADSEFEPDLLRWADNSLIKLVQKFSSFTKGDIHSFKLPREFLLFPQFIYYLRRSQFIQVFNYSPDETAFFRATLLRENVTNGLTMVQPLLHAFDIPPPEVEIDDEDDEQNPIVGEEVLLELSSRHPERILLLDTFFHLVIWYGRKIAKWREDKIWLNEEYGHEYVWFKKLLLAPKQECINRMSTKFPCPNLIECDEDSGQERFLVAKLNPDNSKTVGNAPDDLATGDVWSDDVSLKVFMDHLKKLAVNPQ